MEKINTEILVSSLFEMGFDQVDALLFTCILGQLSIDNQELKTFEFKEREYSQIFNNLYHFSRFFSFGSPKSVFTTPQNDVLNSICSHYLHCL